MYHTQVRWHDNIPVRGADTEIVIIIVIWSSYTDTVTCKFISRGKLNHAIVKPPLCAAFLTQLRKMEDVKHCGIIGSLSGKTKFS